MAKAKSTKNVAPAEAVRVSLVAVEPIRIDGVDVQPGETFEAEIFDADALVASGAARATE